MVASAPEPSDVALVVVGGGPTGIAALFEARRQGIEAVGLEAGPGPTTSIREYLNGLVLIPGRPTTKSPGSRSTPGTPTSSPGRRSSTTWAGSSTTAVSTSASRHLPGSWSRRT